MDHPSSPHLFIRHGDQLAGAKALARYRGSQFVDAFDEIFRTEGLKVLKTPEGSPVANTFTVLRTARCDGLINEYKNAA